MLFLLLGLSDRLLQQTNLLLVEHNASCVGGCGVSNREYGKDILYKYRIGNRFACQLRGAIGKTPNIVRLELQGKSKKDNVRCTRTYYISQCR